MVQCKILFLLVLTGFYKINSVSQGHIDFEKSITDSLCQFLQELRGKKNLPTLLELAEKTRCINPELACTKPNCIILFPWTTICPTPDVAVLINPRISFSTILNECKSILKIRVW